jgi:hypothetical protein
MAEDNERLTYFLADEAHGIGDVIGDEIPVGPWGPAVTALVEGDDLAILRERRKKRLPVGSAACHAVEQQENRAVTANGAVQARNSSVV